MTELGQTTDPVALIPGSADAANQTAATWWAAADTASTVAEEILGVATPESWTGDSADGFGQRRTVTGNAWGDLSTALTAAADAMSGYAQALAWAQQQAQEAISLWENLSKRRRSSSALGRPRSAWPAPLSSSP
ncbi:putative T7SS-secreted protein [Microbacterium sp. cx-59]|uniref:putative T7SS-secreted protein n=1 Tax=Microbacterium sp. cx-59 TaxID=2891207 RepID=UPI001E365E6E|nr:hypothetical protein [Microbacterium sp. cx-59]MCC4906899.1 hypothetical protein [Microbacterium sp. cx-59]